jgi:hypothetical protein
MKKIFNASPEGNETSDIAPARYFNLAIEQINLAETWLRDTKEVAQPLLLHIEVFVLLAKRYPDLAKGRARKLDIPQIKKTFNEWFERVKIPKEFADGIKSSGDKLIAELEKV